jgi:hypothetical protein
MRILDLKFNLGCKDIIVINREYLAKKKNQWTSNHLQIPLTISPIKIIQIIKIITNCSNREIVYNKLE